MWGGEKRGLQKVGQQKGKAKENKHFENKPKVILCRKKKKKHKQGEEGKTKEGRIETRTPGWNNPERTRWKGKQRRTYTSKNWKPDLDDKTKQIRQDKKRRNNRVRNDGTRGLLSVWGSTGSKRGPAPFQISEAGKKQRIYNHILEKKSESKKPQKKLLGIDILCHQNLKTNRQS